MSDHLRPLKVSDISALRSFLAGFCTKPFPGFSQLANGGLVPVRGLIVPMFRGLGRTREPPIAHPEKYCNSFRQLRRGRLRLRPWEKEAGLVDRRGQIGDLLRLRCSRWARVC